MDAIVEQFSAVLWNVINRPSIVDLIDILLLTFIIYEMLVHLRHTRVSQTLKGIVVLLLATWLSDVIGMRTIHVLLSWIINAGPVLLIVLFQQEIRRVLEELGATNLLDSATRMQQTSSTDLMIDEMILALEHMSRRRVGALIVIENRTRLNDVIATGTRVDGVISQKTEDLVGPYELHDFFLYYMLRCGYSPAKIYRIACLSFAGQYGEETILKWLRNFYRRFFQQQFKRSCLPDGPKVGSVAVSPRGDLRMPSDACARIWLEEAEAIS